MEQQTWVTLLGFAGFGLALMGYLANMKRELKADNAGLRTELKADNASLRTELKADNASLRTELKTDMRVGFSDLKADLGRIDARLAAVENRTYDISTRLPPAPAARSPHAS